MNIGKRIAIGVFGVAVALGGGALVGSSPARATGAAAVSVTQSSIQNQVGTSDQVTADVTVGGVAAPDGTAVRFQPSFGLAADHVYTAIAVTPTGKGYYLAATSGAVRAFGDAVFQGQETGFGSDDELSSMALAPSGDGYWLLRDDGSIYNFGVSNYGSPSIAKPDFAETMAPFANGAGYWILSTTGTVYEYPGGQSFPTSVSGQYSEQVVADPNGGCWVVYSNGTIVSVDGAASMSAFTGIPSGDFLVSAASNSTGTGMWAVTLNGKVLTSGSGVPNDGDLTDNNTYFTSIAASPDNAGYFAVAFDGQVEMAGSAQPASPLRDPWSALTSSGRASIDVTHFGPGYGGVTASAAGASSTIVYSEWSVPPGYWLASTAGGIANEGAAPFQGAATQYHPRTPIAAVDSTPDGHGYWELTTAGGLFNFGDAQYNGSAVGFDKTPFVGMAGDPFNLKKYWLVARDGAVFAYGAAFHGSAYHLTDDAVAITADPTGAGYWVISASGGIFAFGAPFNGPIPHNGAPMVGLASTPDGHGYWAVNANGAVFAVGDAYYVGGGVGRITAPVVGIMANPGTYDGYWIVESNGSVIPCGSAPAINTTPAFASPVVGAAVDPNWDADNTIYARSHIRSIRR